MKLYQGTNVEFDKFDLNFCGQGDGGALRGKGINLSESPEIAEYYRGKLKGADNDLITYSIDGVESIDEYEIEAIKTILKHGGIDNALNEIEYNETEKEYLSAIIEDIGDRTGRDEGLIERFHGCIYEVKFFETGKLLDWDNSMADQPFDPIDLSRHLIGKDGVEERLKTFLESLELSQDEWDAEDDFNNLLLSDMDNHQLDYCKQEYPDFDWDELVSFVGNKGITIDPDSENDAGKTIYNQLSSIHGEDKANEILSGVGIVGIVANNMANPIEGEYRNYTIWDLDTITMHRTYTNSRQIDDLISSQENSNNKTYSYGMSY